MLGFVIRIAQIVTIAFLWSEIYKYMSTFNKFPLVMIAFAVISLLSVMSLISGEK